MADETEALLGRLGVGPEHASTVAALRELGISEEAMRRALERGRLEDAVFDAVLDPERAGRHVTAREIEAAGGLSVAAQQEFMLAFGLAPPEPDEPYFTDQESLSLIELARVEDVWPARARTQAARVYGLALAQLVRAELVLFRLQFEAGDEADGASLATIRGAFERLLPIADSMLVAVHHRWVEHELAAAAAFDAAERVGAESVPGSVRVTILFVDLKSFTAYADTRGDAAAVAAIDGFADVVYRLHAPGEIVKALGDGYMLAYASADDAVAAARRIAAEAGRSNLPAVHASAHTGLAIAREGDYLGGAVNIAARLLNLSAGGELLATAETAVAADSGLDWERRGEQAIRGLRKPVDVVSLRL